MASLLCFPRLSQRLSADDEGSKGFGQSILHGAQPSLSEKREAVEQKRYQLVVLFIGCTVIVFIALYVIFVFALPPDSNEEPLTLYEGISVWPAELLRIAAGLLSFFLIFWGALRLKANQLALTEWFFSKPEDGEEVFEPAVKKLTFGKFVGKVLKCNLLACQTRDRSIHALKFWRECMFHASPVPTAIRTIIATVLFGSLAVCLLFIWGFPSSPARGELSRNIDRIVLVCSIPCFLLLTFFVVDATLLCKRFIGTLSERHTDWPDHTRAYYGAILGGTKQTNPNQPLKVEEAYDDWIDVRLIAARTEVVGKLVYYPLFVLLLLLVARSTLFDRWDWPLSLIMIFAMCFVIVIACAIVLRREAERARNRALRKLERRVLVARGGGVQSASLASQLDLMYKNMQDMREGAFASFTQQPVVKALTLFLSASGLVVLEYLGVIAV